MIFNPTSRYISGVVKAFADDSRCEVSYLQGIKENNEGKDDRSRLTHQILVI